jgi:hypothetical protein
VATDQTWLARVFYPDHFDEAGERIHAEPEQQHPTQQPQPVDFDGGAAGRESISLLEGDPHADHNTLVVNLLAARHAA